MKRSNFMSYLLLLATNYQFIVELKRTDRMEKEKKERTGSCCMESDFFLLHSIWCVLCIDLTVRCCLSVFIIIIVAVVVVRLEKKRTFSAFQKNNNSFRTPTIQSMKTVPQIHYIRFELEMQLSQVSSSIDYKFTHILVNVTLLLIKCGQNYLPKSSASNSFFVVHSFFSLSFLLALSSAEPWLLGLQINCSPCRDFDAIRQFTLFFIFCTRISLAYQHNKWNKWNNITYFNTLLYRTLTADLLEVKK